MTKPPDKPDSIFFIWVRQAIGTMRDAGMNDALIACVLTEIRSAAIHEERGRIDKLFYNNPPHHISMAEYDGCN
jgi:hypothetical protein